MIVDEEWECWTLCAIKIEGAHRGGEGTTPVTSVCPEKPMRWAGKWKWWLKKKKNAHSVQVGRINLEPSQATASKHYWSPHSVCVEGRVRVRVVRVVGREGEARTVISRSSVSVRRAGREYAQLGVCHTVLSRFSLYKTNWEYAILMGTPRRPEGGAHPL